MRNFIALVSAAVFVLTMVCSCGSKETKNILPLLSYEMKTFRVESSGGCAADSSLCASYTVEYPVIKGLTAAANDSLQKKIAQAVDTGNPLGGDTLSFEVAGRSFIKDYEEEKKEFPADAMAWYYSAAIEVTIVSDTLVSLAVKNESFTGGAHGGFGTYFINLNPATGATLTLDDFLKPGYGASLEKIAEAEFRKSLELSDTTSLADGGFEFADNKFKLNSNYGFTSKGILFVFNTYEIGPYVLGAQEILIPYEKIRALKE